MAYKSVVANNYISVEEIDGESTTLSPTGVKGDDDFKSSFNLSPGTLDLRADGPCEIRLNNIDEGDRLWKISGPDYSGNLSFTYTSS